MLAVKLVILINIGPQIYAVYHVLGFSLDGKIVHVICHIGDSSTQRDSVHNETKALCPIRNFIIKIILITL